MSTTNNIDNYELGGILETRQLYYIYICTSILVVVCHDQVLNRTHLVLAEPRSRVICAPSSGMRAFLTRTIAAGSMQVSTI